MGEVESLLPFAFWGGSVATLSSRDSGYTEGEMLVATSCARMMPYLVLEKTV